MVASPWIESSSIGWGNVLIDFIVWEYKILGIQHGTLRKRFCAIRFVHIAECRGGLSLRAHRVETVIKSIKLRGKTMKKVPLNADLIRRIRKNLNFKELQSQPLHIALIWAGLLLAFFFRLRISELLNLTPRDIKFTDDDQGAILSIPIRSSKNDQERKGETRSLRANPTELCPAQALDMLRKWYRPSKHPSNTPSSRLDFGLNSYTLRSGPVPLTEYRPLLPTRTHSALAEQQPCSQQGWIGSQSSAGEGGVRLFLTNTSGMMRTDFYISASGLPVRLS